VTGTTDRWRITRITMRPTWAVGGIGVLEPTR
jgi:hypothetical protein